MSQLGREVVTPDHLGVSTRGQLWFNRGLRDGPRRYGPDYRD